MTEEAGGKPARCRVNWYKPYQAGTICNHVNERGECLQEDPNRCPCGGIVRIPIFKNPSSAPQPAADPTRYMSEEQRKYILSFKEEDPLLMAYVEGQKAAEQRIKDVIAELEHLEDECAAKAIETADTSWGFHYGGMADGFKKAISLLRGGDGG